MLGVTVFVAPILHHIDAL